MQWINSWVGHRTKRVSDTITRPSNTTAYAAGDAISEVTTNDGFTFSEVAEPGGNRRSGSIDSAVLISSANQSTKLDAELWIFAVEPGEDADNSAFSPTDAELADLIGVIDFPSVDWKEGNGNAVCVVAGVQLPFKCQDKDVQLFGRLVARNAYTPVSAEEFTVVLTISED